ncbi:CD209 antigen-like protein D isoform 2-T2 [Pholidichthys leucotaenia]
MWTEIQPKSDLKVKYNRGVHEQGEGRGQCEVEDGEQSPDLGLHTAGEKETMEEAKEKFHPALIEEDYEERKCFRGFKVVLGVLCVLILSALMIHYILLHLENKQLLNKLAESEKAIHCVSEENPMQEQTSGWKSFRSDYYYISTKRKNWRESREDCQKRGAALVMINHKAKHDFFRQLNKSGDFWIGLESVKQEWTKKWEWRWVDGSQLSYTVPGKLEYL